MHFVNSAMFIIFHVWHPHIFYVLRYDPELSSSLVFNIYLIHALKASNLCMGFVLILTESEIVLNSPIEFGLYFGCFLWMVFIYCIIWNQRKKKWNQMLHKQLACCEIFAWQEMHSKIKYQIIENLYNFK